MKMPCVLPMALGIHIISSATNSLMLLSRPSLDFDGGGRNQLCEELWNEAKPKVERYWREGAHDALEELRTKELYGHGHSRGV